MKTYLYLVVAAAAFSAWISSSFDAKQFRDAYESRLNTAYAESLPGSTFEPETQTVKGLVRNTIKTLPAHCRDAKIMLYTIEAERGALTVSDTAQEEVGRIVDTHCPQ
jgi:hypothetical protein